MMRPWYYSRADIDQLLVPEHGYFALHCIALSPLPLRRLERVPLYSIA